MSLAEKLKSRRAEVLAELGAAEKSRASGWHPASAGAEDRERKGELNLSERVIAFQDDTQIYVCGDDVARVNEAIAEWLPRAEKTAAANPGSNRTLEGAIKVCQRVAERSSGRKLDADSFLEFGTQEWNNVNMALAGARLGVDGQPQGIQVVLAGL